MEFLPVVPEREGIPSVSEIAQVDDPVLRGYRVIPVLDKNMVHLTGVREKERAGAVPDDIGMPEMEV